ncbi:Phosphopantetheine attachment site [Novipirellula aureliae]|uniref:Phosphopantetheine attachment site n=1 Tax=Novipirellula aureliae TaxID=2527966 RepID=A0A5C6E2B4_9BACT|nr:phosphopantetheine-binding protein [Novipirellula aureliae]TWU41289.1 Phosphopantetheine attachment site [Novipirellula aureliae]
MKPRDIILRTIHQVAKDSNKELEPNLDDNSVLLQIGLDSLDFAIVIAKLEQVFDLDPFALMEEAVYPRTLGDLVRVYEQERMKAC